MSERALLFRHAGQHFSLPASVGREAFVPTHLMPLPGGQGALLGLTEVRGLAVPLLNLSALIGNTMPPEVPELALLLEIHGELLALPAQHVVGLLPRGDVPTSTELLTEPSQVGDLTARHIRPAALLDAVRRLIS